MRFFFKFKQTYLSIKLIIMFINYKVLLRIPVAVACSCVKNMGDWNFILISTFEKITFCTEIVLNCWIVDFFTRFTHEKISQNNFSRQNFSVESNYCCTIFPFLDHCVLDTIPSSLTPERARIVKIKIIGKIGTRVKRVSRKITQLQI